MSAGRRLRLVAGLVAPLVVAVALTSCTRADDGRVRAPADSAAPAERAPQATAPSVAPATLADSVAASPLSDSAAPLDARFREAREAINRDAHTLAARPAADRRSAHYARRFDDLRRRTLAAESLRGERDAIRKRLARQRAAPPAGR